MSAQFNFKVTSDTRSERGPAGGHAPHRELPHFAFISARQHRPLGPGHYLMLLRLQRDRESRRALLSSAWQGE